MAVMGTPQNFSGWNIAHPRYTSSSSETMPDRMQSNMAHSSGAIAGDRDPPEREETDHTENDVEQVEHGGPPDEDSSTVEPGGLGSH
jgi:hypothetical protein